MLGLGLGVDKIRPVSGGLLDLYPATAAYSLRALSSSTTNVVRVREDGSNTEQDFTASEITDGTLTTFTGAGDGFVVTWYDQSGNSNDATQSTAANQPQIVSSGSLILENGKPAIDFDGTDDILQGVVTIDYHSIFIVGLPATNALNNSLFDINLYFAWEAGQIVYRSNAFSPHRFPSDATQGLISVIAEGASDPRSVNAYRNGTASTDNPQSLNLGSDTLRIGGLSATGEYDSPLQEVIIYDSDQSANRTAIESNINNYYNIY